MKKRKSITIDPKINKDVEDQANAESRSFSNMIEHMAKKYLTAFKKSNNGDVKNV